jgi:inorganic pyrophosphatase
VWFSLGENHEKAFCSGVHHCEAAPTVSGIDPVFLSYDKAAAELSSSPVVIARERRSHEDRKPMVNYLELPVGEKSPEVINAVIEIPAEGINKYEYDKTLHVFRLDRNLYSPVHYPGDYGFIPSTLSEDGDPLDVLVLVDAPSFPGCVMQVRPIGLLEMLDQGVPDEKVLAVGKNNPRYADVWNYSEIYPHMLKEMTHFFAIYKDLEGKRVEVKGWHDAAYARTKVVEAANRFKDNKTAPELGGNR